MSRLPKGLLLVLLLGLISSLGSAQIQDQEDLAFLPDLVDQPVYNIELDEQLTFYWQLDYDSNVLIAEVQFVEPQESRRRKRKRSGAKQSNGNEIQDWISVGFSDYGELSGADLCTFWSDWKGEIFLQVSSNQTITNINHWILDFRTPIPVQLTQPWTLTRRMIAVKISRWS